MTSSAALDAARAELRSLLQQVSARCAELPAPRRIASLRRPGAWRDHPLPANSPAAPYWVALPATFEITNIPAPALRAALANIQPLLFGDGGSLITIAAPVRSVPTPPTRADVSSAVLAKTIAALGAPNPLQPAIAAALARTGAASAAKRTRPLRPVDDGVTGDGTAAAPFQVKDGQPLYLLAPVTLAFAHVPPAELSVASLFPAARSL